MRIDIPALALFVAAVEDKSLSRAAEREHIVTSAASKRIIELERQLGVVLLHRHGRGVEPTPAGAMLYQRARSILRGVRLAEEAVAEFAPTGMAKIRLAANRSTMLRFIPRVISRYLARTPDTRIDLLERLSFDIPRLVIEGEADIGVYHAPQPAPGLASTPYLRDRVVLVVPVGHPLASRASLRLEEAVEHDFIGYFPRHSFEAFMELAEPGLSRPLNVRVQVTSFEARCTMVREGVGLAVMPEQGARGHAASMGLACVPLEDAWASRQYYLCVREGGALQAPVAALVVRCAVTASL
jgi:DNA-binding transcriptional LysR family regulator